MKIKKILASIIAGAMTLSTMNFTVLAADEKGTITYGYTSASSIWGEATTNSQNSLEIEVYAGAKKLATTTLNNIDGIIDGDVTVTWNAYIGEYQDSYWTTVWHEKLYANEVPDKVVLISDGVVVAENIVKLNGPDDLNKIKWTDVNSVASFEVDGKGYKTFSEALNAATNGDVITIYTEETQVMPGLGSKKDITIQAADGVDAEIEITQPGLSSSDITFNDVTLDYGDPGYRGLQHSGDLVYNNCTINGQAFLYGASDTFNNCTFNQPNVDLYNVWTYSSALVTFNNCTFYSGGRSVLVYNDGDSKLHKIVLNDCELNASQAVDGKAAVEIDPSNCSYSVEINNSTANGFGAGSVSGNSLYNNKKVAGAEKSLMVAVDGELVVEDVNATYAAKNGVNLYKTLQDAVDAVEEGDTITLVDDITINEGTLAITSADGTEWYSAVLYTGDKDFTIDLNGKEINVNSGEKLNRNFIRVDNQGSKNNTITIKNGKVIADDIRYVVEVFTDNNLTATVELEDMYISSNRKNGYTVVTWAGGIVEAENVTLDTQYTGGFVAGGGEIAIDDCNVTITGTSPTAPWNSVALAVSSGTGKMTVNGGNYTVYSKSTDSVNMSVIGVMSSGGELIVNDGVFTQKDEENRNRTYNLAYCDNAAGAAVSKLTVNGGTFTSVGDFSQWNSQGGKNYALTLNGGIYNVNPVANITKLGDGFKLVKLEGGYKVVDSALDTTGVSVYFRPATSEVASEKVYDIVLKAADGQEIYEWETADLTFELTSDTIVYSITADENVTLTKEGDNRYMFSMDGVNEYERTDDIIKIGQVKFAGYGEFTFKVADVAENVVMATEVADSIAKEFTVAGGNLTINGTDIDADGDKEDTDDLLGKIDGEEIKVPTKDLIINVTFNNKINDSEVAYQDMKVVISGGDLAEDIVKNFGSDENALVNNVYTVEAELTEDVVYNVTVTGAGYRTARYEVKMDADKTLNFWNNVKDIAVEIEAGKEKMNTNFLAGDIVADNVINVYDLSAVVSYFGTESNTTNNFVMYDLNRDGMIDSRDVAYVLVSWGK